MAMAGPDTGEVTCSVAYLRAGVSSCPEGSTDRCRSWWLGMKQNVKERHSGHTYYSEEARKGAHHAGEVAGLRA